MATYPTRKRRTRPDGERSYRMILDAAARLATIEGLEGLSIRRLAQEIGMSTSGLYAHFDSKQDLQLATIAAAEDVLIAQVIEPALKVPEGLGRLELLCDRYLSYVKRGVFPGGCFFCPAPPSGTAAPGRSEIACSRCSPAGANCSKRTCALPSKGETSNRTSTPVSSRSRSTPCSTRQTVRTCSSATPPRSTERGRQSATGSPARERTPAAIEPTAR